jgi:hypothetical protein
MRCADAQMKAYIVSADSRRRGSFPDFNQPEICSGVYPLGEPITHEHRRCGIIQEPRAALFRHTWAA